jgi:hypothetical protein
VAFERCCCHFEKHCYLTMMMMPCDNYLSFSDSPVTFPLIGCCCCWRGGVEWRRKGPEREGLMSGCGGVIWGVRVDSKLMENGVHFYLKELHSKIQDGSFKAGSWVPHPGRFLQFLRFKSL